MDAQRVRALRRRQGAMMRIVHRLLPLSLAIVALSCGATKPSRPNRPPIINSISLTPSEIGPADSALLVCNASDPDGDRLYFDYLADARLRLKDASGIVYRFDSPSDSQIFYYGSPPSPTDTAWIQCVARDRKGGSAGVLVRLLLKP